MARTHHSRDVPGTPPGGGAGGGPGGSAGGEPGGSAVGSPASTIPRCTVATFNLHAGVDGWGRPYHAVEACAALDADVLVLEECWTEEPRAPGGAPSGPGASAPAIAAALGYSVVSHVLARGRRAGPHPDADRRWMRPLDWRGTSHALYLDSHRPLTRAAATSERFRTATPGAWSLAVLSRLPVLSQQVLDLGRLRRDRARRAAVVVRVDVGGVPLLVVGVHMSHLSHGSPAQYRRLARLVAPLVAGEPAVLAGDMNLWGPPVRALLPGWRRAVRGRTWPSWRPHSQVDHILVRGPVAVLEGRVLPAAGSDHRPVRVLLAPVPTDRTTGQAVQ